MSENQRGKNIIIILMPVLFLAVSVLVALLLCRNGTYPDGSETMYYLHRGNAVYEGICEGKLWLGYDASMYNGIEPLRYDAPLSAYVIALCIAASGGNVLNGYLVFVCLLCFAGAMVWLYIGAADNRPLLGGLLGILWFFLPNNLYTLLVEGNLERSLAFVFLPFVFFAVYRYLKRPEWKRLPAVTLGFLLIVLCDYSFACMTAVTLVVFLLCATALMRCPREAFAIVLSAAFGFALSGIWLYASVKGGNALADSAETLENFFQSLWLSVNPMERISGDGSSAYFGLAALILAVFGALFSKRKSVPGFLTAIVLFLCTSTAAYAVFARLPGNRYFHMLSYISIALCMILYSFLEWDTLRRPIVALAVLLLCLDVVPSLGLIYGSGGGELAEARLNEQQEAMLIGEAQKITDQRLALLDGSSTGAMGAYLVTDWKEGVSGSFGSGWQSAGTAKEIVQLNRALSGGGYLYLFDRLKQLGNDSVIVQVSQIDKNIAPLKELDRAAKKNGYELVKSNDGYRLYHMDMEGSWGTKAQYRALGIGSSAGAMSLVYPAIKEADSVNLNDYTFEELAPYETIYLAGFTYDDRESAEELVLRLGEAGVRIVIAADTIPADRTHGQSFLGVTCNTVSFSNGFPELHTQEGVLSTDLFPQGHTKWQTVYLEGLSRSLGTVKEENLTLDFYGTVKNENIVMVGLNLPYFYTLTKDASVGQLFGPIMCLSEEELPKRELVPLEIRYGKNSIEITSPEKGVNTTLAYHDMFESDQKLECENHLLTVQKGTTVITFSYPCLLQGIILSSVGAILMLLFWWYVRRRL